MKTKKFFLVFVFLFFVSNPVLAGDAGDLESLLYPNYRKVWLDQADRYEKFVADYPDSPLTPDVKLRLAEIYKDIENVETNEWRFELWFCTARSSKLWEKDRCRTMFMLRKAGTQWRDPFYAEKAVKILLELIEQHGHKKRYAETEGRAGRLYPAEEEIGAIALFFLADMGKLEDRGKIYERILKEYKVSDDLKKEIEEFLKTR